MESFFSQLSDSFKDGLEANSYSALNLAYLGDAVFEICVRTSVMRKGNIPVNKMHIISKNYVKAESQSKMYYKIYGLLDEEEKAVLKRGRNAKSHTTAKNATINDYRHATGLEALFGYLYLKGKYIRMLQLFEECIEEIKNEK